MKRAAAALLALALIGAPTLAHAAGAGGGRSELVFLGQIVVLLAAGRLIGELMQRMGQPAVMGQLIAGILLGPSVFGALWPAGQHALFPNAPEQKAMLDGVAQLGVLLLLLMTGMETDIALVRRVQRAAMSVSIAGVAVPFACGFALGEMLPDSYLPRPDLRLVTSLFLGTALSIASVKMVAMVVRDMGFMRRKVGQVIVASAIVDDTIGWVIIAITFSIALHGAVDLWSVGQAIVGTIVFLVASFTFGRRLVVRAIRWANDDLQSEAAVVTAIMVITGLLALTTHFIGVHSVLGAFVAGVLIGQSPILTRQIDAQLRGLITGLFAPVFFGVAGLHADLSILRDPHMALLAIGFVLIASVGKFGGAFIGGTLGGLKPAECLALASGMNARGSTEVIVATIGLSIGALSESLFTIIVAMAVITTLAMPPMLRWALGRLPLDDEERARLEREAFEERGFVSNLERLLVATDESPNARLAARVAGLIAGTRGMPVTVIRFDQQAELPPFAPAAGFGDHRHAPEKVVAHAARAGQKQASEPAAARGHVEVSHRAPQEPMPEAIASEARKGYDLLILGLASCSGETGGFDTQVSRAARTFTGPLAIVSARGEHISYPQDGPLDILAPITGSEISRRGLEVAVTLARATGARLTALYAPNPDGVRRASLWTEVDDAILRDAVTLADRYGVTIRTLVRRNMAPAASILRQAHAGEHNLVVMGVARRPGETLALGGVADAVLAHCDKSVVFVAS